MNAKRHLHPGSLWLVALSAFVCIAYASSAVSASPSSGSTSITVDFGDLNLSTSAGISRLYGRIENAARGVCGAQPANTDVQGSRAWKSCYANAVSNSVAQVNRPGLTALHDGKTGRKAPQLAKR